MFCGRRTFPALVLCCPEKYSFLSWFACNIGGVDLKSDSGTSRNVPFLKYPILNAREVVLQVLCQREPPAPSLCVVSEKALLHHNWPFTMLPLFCGRILAFHAMPSFWASTLAMQGSRVSGVLWRQNFSASSLRCLEKCNFLSWLACNFDGVDLQFNFSSSRHSLLF